MAETQKIVLIPEQSMHLRNEIITDIKLMIRFALMKGKKVNIAVNSYESLSDINELLLIHSELSTIISPATPKSILYLDQIDSSSLSIKKGQHLYKIPIVKKLIITSIILLTIFICAAISPYVNKATLHGSIETGTGLAEFIDLLFIGATAGLGTIFCLFNTVINSIKDGSIVEEDNSYNVMLIILGVISGLFLSQVVNIEALNSIDGNKLDNVFLAFIGGFSAETFRSILETILKKVNAVFEA